MFQHFFICMSTLLQHFFCVHFCCAPALFYKGTVLLNLLCPSTLVPHISVVDFVCAVVSVHPPKYTHSSHPCPNAFHVLEFKAFTIFRFSSSDIVAKETEDASTVKIFPKWVHARLLSANVHKHFHVCVHFYFVCISIVIQHFFFACISIVLQHFFYAYFLCISTLLHISTV